jgi:hypothetical protein
MYPQGHPAPHRRKPQHLDDVVDPMCRPPSKSQQSARRTNQLFSKSYIYLPTGSENFPNSYNKLYNIINAKGRGQETDAFIFLTRRSLSAGRPAKQLALILLIATSVPLHFP